MKQMKRFPFVPTIVVLIVISYLSLAERPIDADRISLFEGADKLVHGCMYLVLVGVGCFDLYRMLGRREVRYWGLMTLGAVLCGGVMELLQERITDARSSDVIDFIANCSGAVTGMLLAWWIVPWLCRRMERAG